MSDDFFIGWAEKNPPSSRRFFLGCAVAFGAGMGGMGALLASQQAPVGSGRWGQGDVREWRGRLFADPYPMLLTSDVDGRVGFALLACLGKCGVRARIAGMDGRMVRITGSLIARGANRMIAAIDGPDWIAPALDAVPIASPQAEALGPVRVTGEILDSKCWFGAMRPGDGKIHKACASLCIRSGIPPVLRVESEQDKIFVLSSAGRPCGLDILPFVADRITMIGQVIRRSDLLFLDARASSITRL